jgi:threonine dehydrogenase-like Zn-dependent dehydrogenase
MRAAVFRRGQLVADTVPDPEPRSGQVLVKTLACGICGSDLHALRHAPKMVAAAARTGSGFSMDLSRDIVFGHEFCAEVVDHGPGTQKALKPGTRVCSVPIAITPDGVRTVGYANDAPGGFGEYMVLSEMLLLEVPNGLPSEHAALTEPMAVGWHAIQKARLTTADVALVVGCGPVGLAVIAGLRISGVHPIVAADFSPARRVLAETMGADIVIDPAEHSPYRCWEDAMAPSAEAAPSLDSLLGGPPSRGVVFECVGVPGVIQQVLEGATRHTRVIVVGVCMEQDHFEPLFGINKELNIQFVLGYTPEEFAATLRHLAEGQIKVAPMVTDRVGLADVRRAFDELANPERHVKILVEPWR